MAKYKQNKKVISRHEIFHIIIHICLDGSDVYT